MNRTIRKLGAESAFILFCLLWTSPVKAATEPSQYTHYQGVLRDSADAPLDGAFDMVFRFFTADVGGDEILVDHHVGVDAIVVSDGLFSVKLGSGLVNDGSGPGAYTSLIDVFRQYVPVFMEVEVGGEVMLPRVEVVSAPSALNASRFGGRPASKFIDSSATPQQKQGDLSVSGNVQLDGVLTVTSGGPGSGKVLTSDATGAASWQDPMGGTPGPPGPPGAPGPAGSSGPVAGYEIVESPINSTYRAVACSPGKSPIGGGCHCQTGAIERSKPYDDFLLGAGWYCECSSWTGSNFAYVICATAEPFCGDGVVSGDEQCDGYADDACTDVCQADCTCVTCGSGTCDPTEDCSTCPADCGACNPDAPPYAACDNVQTFCASGQCTDGICTFICFPTPDPFDIECDIDPGFSEACVYGTPWSNVHCRPLCLDVGGAPTCPNDLVCNTSTNLCEAP